MWLFQSTKKEVRVKLEVTGPCSLKIAISLSGNTKIQITRNGKFNCLIIKRALQITVFFRKQVRGRPTVKSNEIVNNL